VLAGGGQRYQTCVSLINDGQTNGGWDARAVDTSDHDALKNEAGDFLGVAAVGPGSNIWAGTCMTLHGGSGYRDVEVRLFKFGRVKDRPK
jgi:hypothetical protein